MLKISTNTSSIIVQNSLKNSTLNLNQAVERMSTGLKINHAKDNAANYSISTNMSTKISGYQVAEDNAAMGLDLIATASDSLSLISNHLSRLRDLAEQAANGTNGDSSLNAINQEANALANEIERIYTNTEYNGTKLFTKDSSGFLKTICKRDTSGMTSLNEIAADEKITGGTYSIATSEELAKFASMVNNYQISGGEFVLANDIDLKEYCSNNTWEPISRGYGTSFIFDGNGCTISNLENINTSGSFSGLFGFIINCEIKNLNIKNVSIDSKNQYGYMGGMVGQAYASKISNCNVTGSLKGGCVGGCIGYADQNTTISDCYAEVSVISEGSGAGGLVGQASNTTITGSYSNGNIKTNSSGGGLVGYSNSNITLTNCYSTADVDIKNNYGGGLIGNAYGSANITNCHASGNVGNTLASNTFYHIGGLAGMISSGNVTNSFSTGDICGGEQLGGLIGSSNNAIVSNCYATGRVSGHNTIGGLIGSTSNQNNIQNSYATGKVTATYAPNPYIGDLIGNQRCNNTLDLSNGVPFSYEPLDALTSNKIDLQIGIDGSDLSQIAFDTAFSITNIVFLRGIGNGNLNYLKEIDKLIDIVSTKQTEYGSAQNRLESALEEISTKYENLISSRSTLRDADIAKETSNYIKNQILQEASATLLSTANQSPALALQLL